MPATPSGAKKPQDRKPKSTFGKRTTFPLTLPSGDTIEVLRPGLQGLIKQGILHSLDALTGIVQSSTIPKAEGKPVVDTKKLMADSEQYMKMMDTIDKIVLATVVEPRLYKPVVTQAMIDADASEGHTGVGAFAQDRLDTPLTDDERDDNLAYIDYVGEEDKTFIMNFVMGGSADLEAFRAATQAAVGGAPDGEAAEDATQ